MLAALVLHDPLLSLLVGLIDLHSDEGRPIHGALNFGKGVRRDRPAFRREKPFEAFGNRPQMRFEAPNTEPGEHGSQSVGHLCQPAIQFLAFPVYATGILFLDCWDRHHPAVIFLSAQPTQEGSHQQQTNQTACLCAAMVPIHRDAGGMHHMRLDAVVAQPACQPEPVPACLVGNASLRDRTADLFPSLNAPAVQLSNSLTSSTGRFFRRPTFHSGQHAVEEQAGLTHFHNHDHCDAHFEGGA